MSMTIRSLSPQEGIVKMEKIVRVLAFVTLALLLVIGGDVACKKEAEEVAEEEGISATKEGIIEFDGTVKVAVGKYMYIPEVQGFDIVIQGPLEVGDTKELIGQMVRGEGEFSPENPAILIANTLELKEAEGVWRNIYTRTEVPVLDDYLDLKARNEFEILKDISYDKKNSWEGKERVKVYGRLEEETVKEGDVDKINYKFVVLDEEGKEVGTVLVDNITDFALYYMNKLRLFDKFWFYIAIKDTVDWSIRRRTRELFHADVLFAGLF
jgi:hypothetical protein